jgi:hypothetical protein
VAPLHNALGVTDPVSETAASFTVGLVIHAERFAEAAERAIVDDAVRQLPRRAGSVMSIPANVPSFNEPCIICPP